MGRKFFNILFWSVIAAAFIGPGTVTTATAAGARFGPRLLWALTFSVVACFVLQEAAARVTIRTDRDLGEVLRDRYRGSWGGLRIRFLVFLAVGGGCAAYEAGNILGAVEGLVLISPASRPAVAVAIGILAGFLLWFGSAAVVARTLGVLVALMGASFLYIALRAAPSWSAIARGTVFPSFPSGGGLLILGLVGTTVVPYNLFLGSGIARGWRLGDMRFSLAVSIFLGGIVSMGIVVVGALLPQAHFTYQELARTLARHLGSWGAALFGFGLFAAGFSSAVTAPFAAAVTARGLFARSGLDTRWERRSPRYRFTWILILGIGVLFGAAGVQPIPAIILAQALNGLLLPFVATFLVIVMNDRRRLGDEGVNGSIGNVVAALVLAVTWLLGLAQVFGAVNKIFPGLSLPLSWILLLAGGVTGALAFPLGRAIRSARRDSPALPDRK